MIEFNPLDHTYTYDGKPAPSVTTLIKFMGDDPYKNVPKRTLKNAADYGSKVHSLIERYAMGEDVGEVDGYEGIALRRYQTLAEQNNIVITSCEQTLAYLDDGVPLYCGMYDMFGTIDNHVSLIDIKTTAEVHTDLLKLQLPMYKAALERQLNAPIERTYCLWLPKKDLGRLIEIESPDFDSLLPRIKDAYTKYWDS